MSKGLYEATLQEIELMLYLIGKLSGDDLQTVSNWIQLSEDDNWFASEPQDFLAWMTARASNAKKITWRIR